MAFKISFGANFRLQSILREQTTKAENHGLGFVFYRLHS